MPPDLVSRSQRGAAGLTAPGSPAVSPVKSYCIRTPWPPVTSIAPYEEPGLVPALIRIPALDQGCTPAALVSDVTRTVMLPLPASGRCTK